MCAEICIGVHIFNRILQTQKSYFVSFRFIVCLYILLAGCLLTMALLMLFVFFTLTVSPLFCSEINVCHCTEDGATIYCKNNQNVLKSSGCPENRIVSKALVTGERSTIGTEYMKIIKKKYPNLAIIEFLVSKPQINWTSFVCR
jgi:hypothetical protein